MMMKSQVLLIVFLFCIGYGLSAQDDSLAVPTYPGGADAFFEFLELHTIISRSEQYISHDAEYIARITFTVDTLGYVHHLYVQDVPDPVAEGIHRACHKMPDWHPAMKDGRAVDAHMHIRFHFMVNGNRIKVTWVDEFRSTIHQEGSETIKTILIAAAVAVMLIFLAL